ncbi:MAG TPA: hypothetical protein VK202_12095 [Bacteroidia bacterium]|nr:hypothetical protein [Bacteroidia bacterium]
MNKAHFIHLIEHPEQATAVEESSLREITRTYPYFQTARVLLTKCLHNQNSYLFEKELKTTALYAGNRKKLYDYIHAAQEAPVLIAGEAELEPEPTAQVIHEVIEEKLPEVLIQEPAEITETSEPEKTIPPVAATETVAEVEHTHTTEDIEKPVTVVPDVASPHSFDEWLQLLSNQSLPEVPKTESIVTPPVVEETKQEETAEAISPLPNKNQAFDIDGIISRFITESPSISRPKAEFFNPANMAKMSVEEDEDLVTETLARINLKQGNYKKAIRMFEKLCLKFPEKMPYFVDLIQKIKTEHKID